MSKWIFSKWFKPVSPVMSLRIKFKTRTKADKIFFQVLWKSLFYVIFLRVKCMCFKKKSDLNMLKILESENIKKYPGLPHAPEM